MQAQTESASDETKKLRRCLNDLIGLVALPAMWSATDPPQIARTLIEALVSMLELDWVYIRFNPAEDWQSLELLKSGPDVAMPNALELAGTLLRSVLGDDPSAWPSGASRSLAGLSIITMQLGMHGEIGVLVAASQRPDFAQPLENLLINVAVNQAVAALQGARLLSQQTQLALVLDQRVAQRARELADANEALRIENAERRRVEDALRDSERRARSLIDGIPGFIATLAPNGEVEAVNRQIVEYTGQLLEELKHWGTNGTVHPDDTPHVAEIFFKSIADGAPYAIEQRLRRFDGAYRWFDNRGIPSCDASGRIVRWYVLLTDIDEKWRAQEALRVSELVSREIVDNIPTLISLLSPTGEVELTNRQIFDYSGRTPEQLKIWGTSDLVHPDDRPFALETFKSGLGSGEPFDIVFRMRRFDGVYRWFEGHHRPQKEDGRVVRWCVSVNDIDDRKRAEDALRASERESRLILDNIPSLVALLAPNGELKVINRQIQDYSGKDEEALKKSGRNELIHREDLSRASRDFDAGIRSGQAFVVVNRIRRFDGAYSWFENRYRPVRDTDQRLVGWCAALVDIDDRKRAEEVLRTSEANLKLIISTIPTLAWSARVDGSVDFINQHYLEYVGLLAEQAHGWDWTVAVHPDDLPQLIDIWRSGMAAGAAAEAEARLRRFDGEYRWFLFRMNPLRDTDGNIVQWYGVNTDIEARKRAEEALAKAHSELAHVARVTTLSVLTASIAHEVNQPLSGVITNANTCLRMLAVEPPNVEGARMTALRTIRDGHRASEIVDRLRALFSKKTTKSEHVDLNEAAVEVITLASSDLQRNRVVLRTDLARELPRLTADRVQLQQVILNLLLNASDAMSGVYDRARSAVVRTVHENEGVRLSVEDVGVGLENENAEQLFRAFYTTKSSGMGIGLSVSRSIIESHDGLLWGEPNSDVGATFSFFIPAR